MMDEIPLPDPTRIIPPDYSLPRDEGVPRGLEIHYRGQPIFALHPAFNNLTPPAKFLANPLVGTRYFFTLPRALLDEFCEIGREVIAEETLDLEYELSELCGDHSFLVGFFKGRPVEYPLLHQSTSGTCQPKRRKSLAGRESQAGLDHAMRLLDERTAAFAQTMQAYIGWLMTNAEFLDEHDAILTQWSDIVAAGALTAWHSPAERDTGFRRRSSRDPRWTEYQAAFHAFFHRWRLQRLAAPYLPVPLQPHLGGSIPPSLVPEITAARPRFNLPDIYPVSPNFHDLVEDALRGPEHPRHMDAWMRLVSGKNTARTPLFKFRRLFELQHYWRIFHARHARAFHRKAKIVKEVLAGFLEVDWNTIHRDLLLLNKQLGSGWVSRGKDYPVGPF